MGPTTARSPRRQGVYANEPGLEACREELQSALEDWTLFGLANRVPYSADRRD